MMNEHIKIPTGKHKLLLHCCCAPCGGGIIKRLKEAEISFMVFFYNPNIHPKDEYERRKSTLKDFCFREDVAFHDGDYDPDAWHDLMKGLEDAPERGERCTKCFLMRLERSAEYAKEQGFSLLATTLGISRWKDLDQVNRCGQCAAQGNGIDFWDFNWRKNDGSKFSAQTARDEKFYIQKYCGCVYSFRNKTQGTSA